MSSEFVYCQSEIECGERCETQCDHCKSYYSPLENDYRHFLPHDTERCNRGDCPLHLECARWLDVLPFDTYTFSEFDEENCDFFILKENIKPIKKKRNARK